ncbi:MAG: hypothetical protein LBU09_03905, partial [Endomicrobium sp.]|nr:hypothetical protein [Endomicrobium sp.]
KEKLGKQAKVLKKDGDFLINELKANDYDIEKTFFSAADKKFSIVSLFGEKGQTLGAKLVLKENNKTAVWLKKPQNKNYDEQKSKEYSDKILSLALDSLPAEIAEKFELSKPMLFTIQMDLALSKYQGLPNSILFQRLQKYENLILADAITQELQKYEEEKDKYDFTKLERLLNIANAPRKAQTLDKSKKLYKELEQNDILNYGQNASVTDGVLQSLGLPQTFELSAAVQTDISNYIEENKRLPKDELQKAAASRYGKTIYFDALLQYKNGKKLNLTDFIPFAASMLPQFGIAIGAESASFERYGTAYMQLDLPITIPQGFYASMSFAAVPQYFGAAGKAANAFAQRAYNGDDFALNYLLQKYDSSKDSSLYVYDADDAKKLFGWYEKKEKTVLKDALRATVSNEFGQFSISKPSRNLEKAVLSGYEFNYGSDRGAKLQKIIAPYNNDIALNVLAKLISKAVKIIKETSQMSADNLPAGKTPEKFSQEQALFEKIKELSQKLQNHGSSFSFYKQAHIQRILKQAENVIFQREISASKADEAINEILMLDFPYLSKIEGYLLPPEIRYKAAVYYMQHRYLNLSGGQMKDRIKSVFERDLLYNALAQYKEKNSLQFEEIFPIAAKTALGFTPYYSVKNVLYSLEPLITKSSTEERFYKNLMSSGYKSYDSIKNVLFLEIQKLSDRPFAVYENAQKEEKKLLKWIYSNEKKLIISHFNDKLFANFGVKKLSNKELYKTIFENYSYNPVNNKKRIIEELFQKYNDEITQDALKQNPRALEAEFIREETINEETQREEKHEKTKEEEVLEQAKYYSDFAALQIRQNEAPTAKQIEAANKLFKVLSYLETGYYSDYGFHAASNTRASLGFY